MFREPEGTTVFEMDNLAATSTNDDEENINIQVGYGSKYTSGPLSSVIPPISVEAPKPLSSNTDSRYVFPTKIPSFAYSNFYPQISLNTSAPFVVGIKSKAVTSSLSGEGSSLKVGSFSFGSPVSASAVIKPIFEIKDIGYKNNIYTPMLSGIDDPFFNG